MKNQKLQFIALTAVFQLLIPTNLSFAQSNRKFQCSMILPLMFGHLIIRTTGKDFLARGYRRMAKEYADNHPQQTPLITINSWNEWTETSYLMPCTMYGYGYLEAIKKVFENNNDQQK